MWGTVVGGENAASCSGQMALREVVLLNRLTGSSNNLRAPGEVVVILPWVLVAQDDSCLLIARSSFNRPRLGGIPKVVEFHNRIDAGLAPSTVEHSPDRLRGPRCVLF